MQYAFFESASKMMADFSQLTFGFCHCMDLKPGDALRRLVRLLDHPETFAVLKENF